MKRSFLQLAHRYNPDKYSVNNWLISEKLDGIRCFWDGGISRYIPCAEIPWANIEKHYRLKEQQISTGLWSRYGQVLHAPSWWLDHLPHCPLDGELWIANNKWQELSSIVKSHTKGLGWEKVIFKVFESPSLYTIMEDCEIKETNFKKYFRGCVEWCQKKTTLIESMPFIFNYQRLKKANIDNKIVKLHEQIEIPIFNPNQFIEKELEKIVNNGGEGVIIRNPVSRYECGRSHNVLKYKPFNDLEVKVIGYKWGRQTELGSKLLGLMGAMTVELNGKQFDLSGFTDEERKMVFISTGLNADVMGKNYPGELVANNIYNPRFPIGSIITVRYRELSNDGIPKECRYLRKYENV